MTVDPAKRRALLDLCDEYASSHDDELPAVSLEQFFDGNDDPGSIMCNLQPRSMGAVREQLARIRSRPDVASVLVHIYELMEGDD